MLTNSMQHIYDLWIGTIESYDGALQLLQIVDFIMTWARDIYRPQVRNSLSDHDADFRELSPTSTNPFARSESVSSVLSSQSISHAVETRGLNVHPLENDFYFHRNTQDASSHPFLKWSNFTDISAPLPVQTSIRHANIVAFSFRALLMPRLREDVHILLQSSVLNQDMREKPLDLLEALKQPRYSILLRRKHIWELAKDWTGEDMRHDDTASSTNSDEVVRAVFFFRTICQSHTWQIEREVCCIISSLVATEVDSPPDNELLLSRRLQVCVALSQVRNLFGKESVSYALRNFGLILRHSQYPDVGGSQFKWASPSNQENTSITQYLALISAANRDSGTSRVRQLHTVGLREVLPVQAAAPRFLPPISEDAGKAGAMLAVRPSGWPVECPRFCLFVLPEDGIDNKVRLGQLLHAAIEDRNFYFADSDTAHGLPTWDATDWKLLRDWECLLIGDT
jgi:hypothetical protein